MATYVVSDIHGLKDRYFKMKQALDFTHDTLYVIGDVIDRGKDGIAILLDMMQYDQIKFILGNHEWMMLQYYLSQSDGRYSLYEKLVFEDRWHRNRNDYTKMVFEHLPSKKQRAILNYLKDAALCYGNLIVNKRKFYLVHGSPLPQAVDTVYYVKDFLDDEKTINEAVWNRMEDQLVLLDGYTIVAGHTPTCYLQDEKPYKVYPSHKDLALVPYIDIDCGCACQDVYTQLALLRLDDFEVFYF